jgi:hypothetical protein
MIQLGRKRGYLRSKSAWSGRGENDVFQRGIVDGENWVVKVAVRPSASR